MGLPADPRGCRPWLDSQVVPPFRGYKTRCGGHLRGSCSDFSGQWPALKSIRRPAPRSAILGGSPESAPLAAIASTAIETATPAPHFALPIESWYRCFSPEIDPEHAASTCG